MKWTLPNLRRNIPDMARAVTGAAALVYAELDDPGSDLHLVVRCALAGFATSWTFLFAH